MGKTEYLILAISILVALLVIFIVSFVVYMKTPAPKGCEDIKANEKHCSSCSNSSCQFHKNKEDQE